MHVPPITFVFSASTIDENLSVKGAAGVGATGAMGAVDRLTEEVAASLEERRTLVVWLLDQSLSMQPQREAIAKRLDRIYEELRLPEKPDGAPAQSPLLSSVVAFGKNVTFKLEEPTADLAEIKQAVASIENDPSGVEMTCPRNRLWIGIVFPRLRFDCKNRVTPAIGSVHQGGFIT